MVHNFSSMAKILTQGGREVGIALWGVGRTIEEAKECVARGHGFPQTVYMSCGHKMIFLSEEKLPNQNIPCPCKSQNHWIVKYDLIKERSWWRGRLSSLLRRFL